MLLLSYDVRRSLRRTSEFAVTLHLQSRDVTLLPAVQGVGNPIPVHAIQVSGSTDKAGCLNHRWVLLDGNEKAINFSPRTALKGDVKEEYRGHANLGYPYPHLPDIQE